MKVTQSMLDAAQAALPSLDRSDAEAIIQAALDADPAIAQFDEFAGRALLADIKANLPMTTFSVGAIPPEADQNARRQEPRMRDAFPRKLGTQVVEVEQSLADFVEVDLQDVLKAKFGAGRGVVTLSAGMTDKDIADAVRVASTVSRGKAFTVVPAATSTGGDAAHA